MPFRRATAALFSTAFMTTLIGALPVGAAQLSNEVLTDINQPKTAIPVTPNVVSPGTLPDSSASTLPSVSVSPTAGQAIPYVVLNQGKQQALIPDWSRITFTSFTFAAPGSLSGGDLERQWSAGQTLDQVMTLGDFQNSLNLDGLNLLAVNRAVGRALDGTSKMNVENAVPPLMLSDFALMQHQTIGSLVKAVPDLNELVASEVPPIAALLRPAEGDSVLTTTTIGDLLTAEPNLGTLHFNSLDLSAYKVSDIPGLDRAPFQAFKDWDQVAIGDIPGLKDMPWSEFPTPPNQRGVIGQITTADSSNDATSVLPTDVFSGSNIAGYVNCQQPNCQSLKLSGSSLLQGKRWFSGEQLVRGGSGTLADVNRGLEPTGRNIYGEAFKVVLTQIGESGASSSIYFHACESGEGQILISCSPFGIGPFKFMNYANGDGVFLGTPDAASVQPDPLRFKTRSAPVAAPLVVNLTEPSPFTHKTSFVLLELTALIGGMIVLGGRSLLKSKAPKQGKEQREQL